MNKNNLKIYIYIYKNYEIFISKKKYIYIFMEARELLEQFMKHS